MSGETVLVTGGSGFLGAYCVLRLLQAGHPVRTTVRSAGREQEVRAMVRAGGVDPGDALGFAVADLTSDEGWAAAVEGCAYVLHVASPYPAAMPADENDLIVPARDGTLRVLRAARDAGVRRVVLTSSFAAIGYGHPRLDRALTEQDWTDLSDPATTAYVKSKTLAERAAWEFVSGESLELAVVNPAGILGPLLGSGMPTSMLLLQRLLRREMPALPRLSFGLVDVRDLADLHVRAMTDPAARAERFLALAGEPVWIADLARVLRDRLGVRVPTRQLPNLVVRVAARADPALRAYVSELGKVKKTNAGKAHRLLGWQARPLEETIVDSAESLLRQGAAERDRPRARS
ncbi:dihydroflavonol-4-reductase [Amycolatopsis bartoniae]|uniref:Dihydroflavonol-4-reductase n=1 Tax=Amycolatopsis bartoniae TaxID=941986 RepID=A0A8H9J5Q9_9PSEU|nr:aldehyde reductase [Amycolatopsis bartoniae]MBB2936386.1 dihydroflavonol-4-reductase [Amycolatopsis bartoniae]TVS99194.1 aldehyde reductase [Amycolatopsis bartoniae]GHF89514.1 dihydroflavonol-4-reductase [Amycolatopsis bartoniae]